MTPTGPAPAPAPRAARKVPDAWPVAEVFGPTIQGEGPWSGAIAHFVRLGGCDYACSWCDSPHAVDPRKVRALPKLDAAAILKRLDAKRGESVILSGGNPALHHLAPLVRGLRGLGVYIGVETQGSIWRSWLTGTDLIVVSPKPPSSGMDEQAAAQLGRFAAQATDAGAPWILKFVVGTREDLEWALAQRDAIDPRGKRPFYLSALTPQGLGDAATREAVCASYERLCELVLGSLDARAHRPILLPQLHVIAWGPALGR